MDGMSALNHPIADKSFALIDQEIGEHSLPLEEYAVVRRVIHSTADFEFKHLLQFSSGAIEGAIAALARGIPIITDVSMVKQGILTLVQKTFENPVVSALDLAALPLPGKTRTETGMLQCVSQYPQGIYVIGNAPTALLALVESLGMAGVQPSVVIGAPVGFVSVLESKAALAQTSVPQIRVEGRKGGSPVAAAILNALVVLAWERQHTP